MRDRHGERWHDHASHARGDEAGGVLDVYALLKTLLDYWNDLFRHNRQLRRARSFISLAMDVRNRTAHFAGDLSTREALRYLDAIRELSAAVGAAGQVAIVEELYNEQAAFAASKAAPAPASTVLGSHAPTGILRGKCAPLYRHLVGTEGPLWHASFPEIETVLGFDLPASAHRHPAWWANQESGHRHALAWQAAGWRTRDLNLTTETVTFESVGNPGPRCRDRR